MNIFFYAVQKSTEALDVLNWLKALRPPLHIQVLPSGLGLSSEESMGIRNGDLLIIYVRNQEELQTLLDSKNEYSNYKIYLIFQKDDPELIKAGVLLNSKHYSSVEKNYIHTEETIANICKHNS